MILEAAVTGDEVATLEAMRDKLAADMDAAPPAVVAQIAARLQAVLERLSDLRPARGVTIDDALAARRAVRAGGTKPAATAARRTKPAGR